MTATKEQVLILVLMEDTLRVPILMKKKMVVEVLILVLMEDTLRGLVSGIKNKSVLSLNPCFNGRYSQRKVTACVRDKKQGLNPCFNGRYSQRYG